MNVDPMLTRRQFLKRSVRRLLGAAGLAVAPAAYARWVEPNRLTVRSVRVALERLPQPFDSFRIAHFSDLHLGFHMGPDRLAGVVERTNALNPDLICFTGDLADRSPLDVDPYVPVLSRLRAPYGQFAVTGNHDQRINLLTALRGLQAAGFRVLRNEYVRLDKGGASLYLAGVDDPWSGLADIAMALRGIPRDGCTLLLAHEPDYADAYSRYPVDLQLSDHSHGGQVRIPLIGPILTPSKGHKYADGLYRADRGKLQVFTTRGVGMTWLPIRFACPPEIVLIALATDRPDGTTQRKP